MTSPTEVRTPRRLVESCMGTVFSFDIRAPGVEQAALESAVRWLHQVDETFSTYRESSQISRLGRAEISVEDCVPEVSEIILRCSQLREQTAGYFSAYASGRLDPSGLVKGWAIQRVGQMLIAGGSRNHCVNGGGDVQCAGESASGKPWRIGIAHPLEPGKLAGIVAGCDIAVATFGTAERGAHIVDPHTGTSPTTFASVTIVGRELATVDAYATAAYAMGSAALEWIASRSGFQALIVYPDGTRWSSPGFADQH